MKREADSELITVGGGAIESRQTQASSCVVEVDDRTSCKRIKATTQVNGFIVYTRTKKSKFDRFINNVEEDKRLKRSEEPESMTEFTSPSSQMFNESSLIENNVRENSGVENRSIKSSVAEVVTEARVVECSMVVDNNVDEASAVSEIYDNTGIEIDESSLVEVLIEESRVLVTVSQEIPVEVLSESSRVVDVGSRELANGTDVSCCSSAMNEQGEYVAKEEGAESNLVREHTRRSTRSVRMKEVEQLETLDYKLLDVKNGAISNLNGEESAAEPGPLVSSRKNPIILSKRPMTVKELFDTGLLDGVAVVYMGSIKSQAFGLRGIIKDGGILCSCTLCNDCQVIPPSTFEIHACKQYKRAAQYICFENGKSLLDVLKTCRNTPLHALESTLHKAVSGPPKEKSFTCRRCRGLFSLSCLGQAGPLCNSCSEVAKSQGKLVSKRKSKKAAVCMSSPSRSKIIRKLSECTPKSDNSGPVYMPLLDNGPQKITRKSSNQGFIGKSCLGVSPCIPPSNESKWKLKKMSTKRVLTSKAFQSASLCMSSQGKSHWKITKKDQRLHRLVFEKGGLPDGTELAYYARGQKLLEGYKKGFGIFCYCCKCEVSPSQFEAHAGWASRRKPYAYIYTSNGVSLHEWAITLSKGRRYSAKDNDDLCVICADGGNLLLCDGCPRAFHKECVSLPSIPRGCWYCKYCEKRFEIENFECNENAVAAGRVIGVDPIEQISGRCIRVVKNIEAETSGCALCSASDFSRSGFGPRTIIICDQCEKEYHIGCLRSHRMADLKELPKGKWFCCVDCTRIHSTLQKLLLGRAEKLSDASLEIIRKKQEGIDVAATTDIDVRWRLISGKVACPESRILLSQALAIFHDCFDPIVDPISGRNLIPRMVYGKNMKGQDYGGMCCAVLTVNSSVVSAGLLRVFGREVAELPLVATSIGNRGKGYFQLLFSCIEKLLSFLSIESIILPAAEEAESIWMNRFGFNKMEPEQLRKCTKICYQMVKFKGASMLHKAVPPCRVFDRDTETPESSQKKFQ